MQMSGDFSKVEGTDSRQQLTSNLRSNIPTEFSSSIPDPEATECSNFVQV
jgi:hypothetical protein